MWKKAGSHAEGWPQAAAVDAALARLPAELRATLVEVHLNGGEMADHVRRLGCPETTISRRLGRADRLLVEDLRSSAARARVDAERAEMSLRLQPARSH